MGTKAHAKPCAFLLTVLLLFDAPSTSLSFTPKADFRGKCSLPSKCGIRNGIGFQRRSPICHERNPKMSPSSVERQRVGDGTMEASIAIPQSWEKRTTTNSPDTEGMGDLVDFLQTDTVSEDSGNNNNVLLAGGAAIAVAAFAAAVSMTGVSFDEIAGTLEHFFQNPSGALEEVTTAISGMGVLAPIYFGLFYTLAELLAVPATPLTLSAGYLFGVTEGTLLVLLSASIAASISFVVGKTVLRSSVERILEETPKFKKIDRAVGKEGFKLMLILRLSPIFPFALSNYLYGASSIGFSAYFWGTVLGFAPGTLAYVYTGMVGKELTLGGDSAQPWYIYAAGLVVFGGVMKTLADVASGIVDDLDDEELDSQQL